LTGHSLQKPSPSGTGAAEVKTATDAGSSWLWRSFIVLVLTPCITSSVYFGLLAFDQFVSETLRRDAVGLRDNAGAFLRLVGAVLELPDQLPGISLRTSRTHGACAKIA
jgi:hypothetical protein